MRMSLDALLIGLAFALGACLARSSLCVVAAMQELVEERRATGVLTQALALTAAGAALAGLATVPGHAVLFPADAAVSSSVVIGAVILAAGALVNGGCYLGSILYLGRGRSEFLFTLVGMAASSRLVPSSAWRMMRGDSLRGLADGAPQVACALFLAVALVLVLAAVRNAQRRDEARSLLVRRLATPAVAGALAALLYARHPYFSYGSVLDALAHADAMPVD